jgi:hypothetical protein
MPKYQAKVIGDIDNGQGYFVKAIRLVNMNEIIHHS